MRVIQGPRGLVSILFLLVPLLLPVNGAAADGAPQPQANPVWLKLRPSLFKTARIGDNGNEFITLTAPDRAEDAAVVPISIKTTFAQSPTRYIKTLYLILDNNPAPVAAVFHLTPETGRADIETRVRIEQYTHVRVVVEMNDGKLAMTTAYLKASGGCSAPAGRDSADAANGLGKMKLAVTGSPRRNEPILAQLMIRHPNASGLMMDQVTRLYQPPHYVRRIDVAYAGKPVMSADVDFSISENPNFRFYFTPQADGMLTAQATDSDNLVFTTSLAINPK